MVYDKYVLRAAHTDMPLSPTYLLVLLLIAFVGCPLSQAQARLNRISGGITTGIDYNDSKTIPDQGNVFPANNDRDLQKLTIGPLFLFESTSPVDSYTLRYNPNFAYDLSHSRTWLDQDLNIVAKRNFSKQLSSSLSNHFLYSDDPNLLESSNNSDFNRGRRRYWSNDLNLQTSYTYDPQSTISGGYYFRLLRNEDTGVGGYDNYDKHVADISLKHRLNARWALQTAGSYTRGLFDSPDPQKVTVLADELDRLSSDATLGEPHQDLTNDLSEYRAEASLDWTLSPQRSLQGSYEYSGTVYDAIIRNDINLHNLTLSATYQYSNRLLLTLGGGPSYEKTEGFSANLNYNGHLDIRYETGKNSLFTLAMEKGYDQQNFSTNTNGLTRDQGLTEFWDWQLNFSSELVEDLTGALFLSYRDEFQEDLIHGLANIQTSNVATGVTSRESLRQQSIFNRNIYRSGGSLHYTFHRYWSTSMTYSYREQTSERINDSYTEHRVYLTLAVQKELLRW